MTTDEGPRGVLFGLRARRGCDTSRVAATYMRVMCAHETEAADICYLLTTWARLCHRAASGSRFSRFSGGVCRFPDAQASRGEEAIFSR
jgi:hypothetical protein